MKRKKYSLVPTLEGVIEEQSQGLNPEDLKLMRQIAYNSLMKGKFLLEESDLKMKTNEQKKSIKKLIDQDIIKKIMREYVFITAEVHMYLAILEALEQGIDPLNILFEGWYNTPWYEDKNRNREFLCIFAEIDVESFNKNVVQYALELFIKDFNTKDKITIVKSILDITEVTLDIDEEFTNMGMVLRESTCFRLLELMWN